MSSVEAPATAAAGPSDGPAEKSEPRALAAGLWGILLLSVIFAWWAWQDGAYFDWTKLIGLIGLSVGIIALARFAPWPLDLRRSPAVVVALVAFVLLGCWTAISIVWSPAPDTSISDAQRVFTYALCFASGLWFCGLLGRRSELSLLPIVVAGAFAGAATLIVLLSSDDPRDLLESYDGTLEYPIGYRNANAAFFAVVLFPAIGLAAKPPNRLEDPGAGRGHGDAVPLGLPLRPEPGLASGPDRRRRDLPARLPDPPATPDLGPDRDPPGDRGRAGGGRSARSRRRAAAGGRRRAAGRGPSDGAGDAGDRGDRDGCRSPRAWSGDG